ncbi:MAG: TraR/DksA C4-type zinc finger protein [Betaproteobacteria bacterium]|nr:TraR/DksA C4-type zinc finger protein [Betaproteobacteria bacterium]
MPLNRRETIELASAIEERRTALAAEIRREVARARNESYAELAGAVHDTGDEALADLVADLDNAEVKRDLTEVRELEAARARIADGSYGVCVDCGADVPVARMRAQLAARRCIACQGQYEKTYAVGERPTL